MAKLQFLSVFVVEHHHSLDDYVVQRPVGIVLPDGLDLVLPMAVSVGDTVSIGVVALH